MSIEILSTAEYLPSRKVNAQEMDRILRKRDGWSLRKSGVVSRSFVTGESQSEMGARVGLEAVDNSSYQLEDIDLIICASGTPEQIIPCTASRILHAMGRQGFSPTCFDINSTCLSFMLAFDFVAAAFSAGSYNRALIISSDISSKGLNYDEPESASLMGDGAAAVLVQRSDLCAGVLGRNIQTFSDGVEYAEIRGGGSRIHPIADRGDRADYLFAMQGRSLFKLASERFPENLNSLFSSLNLGWDDVSVVMSHQASKLAIDHMVRRLKIPKDKMVSILHDHGNTIAASLPMVLHEAIRSGRLKRGEKALFLGSSAGVTLGSLIFEY